MTYKVTSDRVSGYAYGDFVTADDLPNCNIGALVAAGHLQPIEHAAPAEIDPEED